MYLVISTTQKATAAKANTNGQFRNTTRYSAASQETGWLWMGYGKHKTLRSTPHARSESPDLYSLGTFEHLSLLVAVHTTVRRSAFSAAI
jgi:hypothetical protein